MPLLATNAMSKVPLLVGVPAKALPENFTPVGNVPTSVMVGVGTPVAVTVKVLATPSTNVALAADVNAGGDPTVRANG